MVNYKFLLRNRQAKGLAYLALITLALTLFLFYVSHSSKSLALFGFSYLLLFDFLSILTAILNIWVKIQSPTSFYPYGYKRFDVLAVFSCSILTILGAFFVIKESLESLFEEKDVNTVYILPASIVGILFHLLVFFGVKNEPFDYVVRSSTSSWLQEHIFDLSESMSRYVPGLSKLLLPRANPIVLIGFAHLFTLLMSSFLIQMGSSYLIDTYASILIACMTIGTMAPFAMYTGKILLQTTPSHLLTQLDKSLREASTLDGVLEFRDEHFWTHSFGVLVGSLHVRIRRDADEQLVLAHVWNKLAGLVQHLTVHIFKDDWMRRTTHQLIYSSQHLGPNFVTPLPPLNLNNSVSSISSSSTPNPLAYNSTTIGGLAQPAHSNKNLNLFAPTSHVTSTLTLNNRAMATSTVDNDFVIVNP